MIFEGVFSVVSIGLALISCLNTIILWIWYIHNRRMHEIFSHKQDDEGEFWVVGLADRGR